VPPDLYVGIYVFWLACGFLFWKVSDQLCVFKNRLVLLTRVLFHEWQISSVFQLLCGYTHAQVKEPHGKAICLGPLQKCVEVLPTVSPELMMRTQIRV
jgi:hypothetical protein